MASFFLRFCTRLRKYIDAVKIELSARVRGVARSAIFEVCTLDIVF
jgi:hypothetical protein